MAAASRYNNLVFRRFAILCALGLAACGPRAGTAPARAGLQTYLQALRSDDPRPLYEMLTKEQRNAIPYETWEASWTANATERAQQAEEVEHGWEQQVQARADVRYDDGQTVTLHQADDGWRLEQALVSQASAGSPEQALGQFLSALGRRDVSAVLALLSKERREAIVERLHNFQSGIDIQSRDGFSELYQVSESRAELNWSHLDVRYRLVFVLEGADWRLDEIHMGPDPAAIEAPEEAVDSGVLRSTPARPIRR